MSERGLMVKLGAVVKGADYYRFLSWRRILFEEYGQELSPETGMEISHLTPKVAARRLCRALGCLYTPKRETLWLTKLTEYYAEYLMDVREEDLLPRIKRIEAYCRERDLCSCVVVPRGGKWELDLSAHFERSVAAGLGEPYYGLAAAEMGAALGQCVLVLSDDEEEGLARVSGVGCVMRAAEFD